MTGQFGGKLCNKMRGMMVSFIFQVQGAIQVVPFPQCDYDCCTAHEDHDEADGNFSIQKKSTKRRKFQREKLVRERRTGEDVLLARQHSIGTLLPAEALFRRAG